MPATRAPAPQISPEELVASVAAEYDDERGTLTASALRRLAKYQREAGRTCTACEERKPLSAFGVDRQKPNGLAFRCRLCAAASKRASRAANV